MDDDLPALLDQVLHLSALVAADQARFERESGLSTSRLHLLWILGCTGPTTQASLAGALGLAARSVTSIVEFQNEAAIPADMRPEKPDLRPLKTF